VRHGLAELGGIDILVNKAAHQASFNARTRTMGEKRDLLVMRRRLGGRCQRGARRALWAHDGIATTAQLLEWAYPRGPGRDRRKRKARAIAVSRAARGMAIVVGRVWPGGNV
jgi:hypothetical protein